VLQAGDRAGALRRGLAPPPKCPARGKGRRGRRRALSQLPLCRRAGLWHASPVTNTGERVEVIVKPAPPRRPARRDPQKALSRLVAEQPAARRGDPALGGSTPARPIMTAYPPAGAGPVSCGRCRAGPRRRARSQARDSRCMHRRLLLPQRSMDWFDRASERGHLRCVTRRSRTCRAVSAGRSSRSILPAPANFNSMTVTANPTMAGEIPMIMGPAAGTQQRTTLNSFDEVRQLRISRAPSIARARSPAASHHGRACRLRRIRCGWMFVEHGPDRARTVLRDFAVPASRQVSGPRAAAARRSRRPHNREIYDATRLEKPLNENPVHRAGLPHQFHIAIAHIGHLRYFGSDKGPL